MNDFSPTRPNRPLRSVLCLPGSNERAIAKIASLDIDAVILDLEDAVAEEAKEPARRNIAGYLATEPLSGMLRIVRVNDSGSRHFDADMALVLAAEPDAVLLPKVRTNDDILDVATFLSENDAPETLRIWAMMETPLAILNAGPIAEMGRTTGGRLDCLVVGLNDLRKDTGVHDGPGRTMVQPWLMQVVLAGRAFGLSVIDSVSNDYRDLAAFEAECAQGRAMGFDGKMLIHPAQIDAANRLFQPSPAEIADAEAIIAAFARPEAAAINALSIDGRMVERLHFQQATALMARVEMIRTRTGQA
jgi:citrate lyase subunit beta/citryl-CoA lyase